VHKVNTVDNHAITASIEFLVQLAELIELLLLIEVAQRKLLLEHLDESVVLVEEGIPVSQITNSQTHSECLGGVSWTNALVCSSEHLHGSLFGAVIFLLVVSIDLNLRDKVSSGTNLQTALVVNAVFVKLCKLLEH